MYFVFLVPYIPLSHYQMCISIAYYLFVLN